ncbi:MAG: hypothetical protein K9J77_00960, partial [Rhodoferax sp.]|nr:hypothetical protein [Rhodoferax sp.]
MTSERVTKLHHDTFESLRHLDADDNEFWLARQLAKVLDYSEYRHFLPVIERAREACHNSGQAIADHYEDVLEMVDIGSGTQRELPDVRLSRDPCYLIVQNGDPSKLVIANGQTYFVRLPVSPLQPVRLELVEGQCVVRQAHHERSRQAHHERSRQAHHERSRQAHHERSRQAHHERS